MNPRRSDTDSYKVLVVDDNRDVADTFAVVVQMWGYAVRTAYSGFQGLKVTNEWEPDCLFLDISMPSMDGYTVAQRIRQQPPIKKVTLIALSACCDDAHRQKLLDSGFDHCMIKPADPNEIKKILAKLDHAKQNISHATDTLEHG